MQLNWWYSENGIVARDTCGKLTVIGGEYDGERDYWRASNKDLLELDGRDPVAQTGKGEELVLLQSNRLMTRIDDEYVEIDEFGPIVALHDDVIETINGKFYKCEWGGYGLDWTPHEPIELRPPYCGGGFTYSYDGEWEPWHTDKYTAIYADGVVMLIEEFIPKDGHSRPGWEYSRSEITLEMDVIDYLDGYLLCSNGDVFCMTAKEVIQRIMVHRRSAKQAI